MTKIPSRQVLSPKTIRGAFFAPRNGTVTFIRDGLLKIDASGRISDWSGDASGSSEPITSPECVWMPGFVDTHVHFPQTRVTGRSSGELLPWLEQTVFPEESRFNDASYARDVAREFCLKLIQNGTTCASIYGSSHMEATEILFEALAEIGLRGQAGPTLMDQGAPAAICVPAKEAIEGCERLIQKWHQFDEGRLQFVITPRFALSCSRELLKKAGELAVKYQLPIQTHLSENHGEIRAVKELYPEHADYLSVYDSFGLCNERSLFGHCVHLTDQEWDQIQIKRAAIAHCPDSNFFLGSGVFPLKKAQNKNIKVGLGSDVGAGRTFNMRRIASKAYDASLLSQGRMRPDELLWLATAGGAEALGLQNYIGRIEKGYDADLIAISVGQETRPDVMLDQILFQADLTPVVTTLVRGSILFQTPQRFKG